HTKKGYGMGKAGQGKMTTHSQKKLDDAELLAFRNRFNLPLSDAQTLELAFYRPPEDSAELQYLKARRAALGGAMPARHTACDSPARPPLAQYAQFAIDAQDKVMSTTMAFVRMLGQLLKAPELGPRLVPIVADEARTFGMANLFKQVGIYSSIGQHYDPEDIGSVLSYREATDGQILEEGISEAGAMASWTAAATSYSVHGLTMLPFYIYYSMFGFQRVGDQIWAAADQRARGFLLGATSGRTTLGGEGLQHQDGSSHLVASTIPNCKSYDPAFAGELALLLQAGMEEMVGQQRDVFYYITLNNDNYAQPSIDPRHAQAICDGGYHFARVGEGAAQVALLGSGAILVEVIKAAHALAAEGITCDVFSVTSWTELARNAQAHQDNRQASHLHRLLGAHQGPIVAASDYVRLLPESIRAYLPHHARFLTLGTDGFGRSDTRAALRRHFEVDAQAIAQAVRTLQ
ncbi:MAG: transketolase-like TK C-terminal-containing protein, partial [Burkholderiaceae bacterium]